MEKQTKDVNKAAQNQRGHIDWDEVRDLQKSHTRGSRVLAKVHEMTERLASTQLGQYAIRLCDRGLSLVEETAEWSVPQETNNRPLQRPLPWVPFLMLIVALRLARIWLSIGAFIIGQNPVTASDVIYFLQKHRRKLRALRVHGLNTMRRRQEMLATTSSDNNTNSYAQQLAQWLLQAVCLPGMKVSANNSQMFNTSQNNQSLSKSPRDEDCDDDCNMTVDQLLNKYANESSEDDSDFVPHKEEDSESTSDLESSDEISDEDNHMEKGNGNEIPETIFKNGDATEKCNDTKSTTATAMSNGKGNGNGEMSDERLTAPMNVVHQKQYQQQQQQQQKIKQMADEERKLKSDHVNASVDYVFNNIAAAAPDDSNDTNDTKATDTDTVLVHSTQPMQLKSIPNTTTTTTSTTTTTTTDPSKYPTIETLTPATSSEDIFYSPIGSPTEFNSSNVAPLNEEPQIRTTVIGPAHSTPTLETENEFDSKHKSQSKQRFQQQNQQHHSGNNYRFHQRRHNRR